MLDEIRATDVHPPLHHVVLWATVRGIGDGELAVRIPSLIVGALVVPMLFVLGRELYGRRTALIAAGLGAVSPLLVWYSQEARMYGILTLLSLVNVWALVRAQRTGEWRYWALLGVSCALTAWTHYLALIQIAVLAVVAVAGLAGCAPRPPAGGPPGARHGDRRRHRRGGAGAARPVRVRPVPRQRDRGRARGRRSCAPRRRRPAPGRPTPRRRRRSTA